jgi:hypothetical protein
VSIPDIIGFTGVFIGILFYLLLQMEIVLVSGLSFSLVNFIASLMILYSLYYSWNAPAVITEIFWGAISLMGVIKYFYNKQKGVSGDGCK